MSNTIRRDKHDKKHKEGLKKKDSVWRCSCHYCVGADRKELVDKIAEKELKTEL
jgi:hypothetical protein